LILVRVDPKRPEQLPAQVPILVVGAALAPGYVAPAHSVSIWFRPESGGFSRIQLAVLLPQLILINVSIPPHA